MPTCKQQMCRLLVMTPVRKAVSSYSWQVSYLLLGSIMLQDHVLVLVSCLLDVVPPFRLRLDD